MASPITASSAIDVQGLVKSLMNVERKPLSQMQSEASRIETKISAYGRVQSALATFKDAATDLAQYTSWRAVKSTSGDSTAVEVTSTSSAKAGQHSVSVQQLAQSQTLTSLAFTSADAVVGGGTLTLQMGTQPSGASSFTADTSRSAVTITLAAGSTLTQVRDAINAAEAGVQASVVKDGDQVRLFLTGTETGGNQAFKVSVSDLDGSTSDTSGLSVLAFDPTASGPGQRLSLVRQATDAQFTLDGVALKARTNRIASVMEGTDLVLKKVTSSAVQIETSVDVSSLQAKVQKFIDAYNAVNTLLSQQTRYDESTKIAGPLQGDRSAVGMLSSLRGIVRETVTGGTFSKLSDVGITLQRDGSLSLSASTFASAATDPSQLESLFSAFGASSTATDRGLAQRFRDLADKLVGTGGTVDTATAAWTARKTANQSRQDALEQRLTAVEKRLLQQYTALDVQLARAQQSSAALTSSLAGLTK